MDKEQEGLKVGWVYGDKVIEFPVILQKDDEKEDKGESNAH